MKLAYDLFTPKSSQTGLSPVILIHCLIETRKTWKTVAPEIAEKTGRKVYAIDCRNHGESPWIENYGSEILTLDLGEFLLQNGISKAIIVGHSMGGVVAMLFALKEPTKVEKLVIEDSPARRSEHRLSNLVPAVFSFIKEVYENQPQGKGEKEEYDYFLQVLREFSTLLKLSPNMLDTYDREKLPMKWNGQRLELGFNLDAITKAVTTDKLVKKLDGIFECDALFMFGAKSQFKVDQDHLIFKHFPKAIKVGFAKAGHFIHHEYPEEFIREITSFINSRSNEISKL